MTGFPSSPMLTRRAEWIWRQRPAPPTGMAARFGPPRAVAEEANRFVYFRKTFTLEALLESTPLYISADGRYQLFVNGIFLGRGPARCDPAFQYYDTYEIAPHLRPGNNVIAVLVHSYGRHMAWYQLPRLEHAQHFGCGGLFVQGMGFDTDDSWRYLESAAWQQDTSAGAVGFVEIYDARQAPVDWQQPDFDDSGWSAAEVLLAPDWPNTPPIRPFPHMVPRDIPPLLEEVQQPLRVHRCAQVTEVADLPNLPAQIGAETMQGLTTCSAEGVDTLLDGGAVTVQTVPGQAVALVLDFGGTVTGRPFFEIDASAGAVIDIGTSERLQGSDEPRFHSVPDIGKCRQGDHTRGRQQEQLSGPASAISS
ncbi:MAG: alpha-L-rhamnosidase N-terminal domain-containing protein [Caldilineaceae bacterium]